jgi:hypothetical protein
MFRALGVRLKILPREQIGHAREVCLRPLERDGHGQAADGAKPPRAPIVHDRRRARGRHHRSRDPHLGVERQPGEPLRHDADDREGAVVDLHGALEDVSARAEPRAPERVADHGDAVAIGTVSSSGKNVRPRAAAVPSSGKYEALTISASTPTVSSPTRRLSDVSSYRATSCSVRFIARQSSTSGNDPPRGARSGPATPVRITGRLGSANGSRRRTAPSRSENMTVLEPMPMASVATTDWA